MSNAIDLNSDYPGDNFSLLTIWYALPMLVLTQGALTKPGKLFLQSFKERLSPLGSILFQPFG